MGSIGRNGGQVAVGVSTGMGGNALNQNWTSDAVGNGDGGDAWLQQTVDRLGLEHTTRREGRPSKKEAEDARTK